MKIIALEEHFLTPAIQSAWESIGIDQQATAEFEQGEIGARLQDLGPGRIALMDEAGIDIQALSITTPALNNLEPAHSVALAHISNDLIASTVQRNPTRFQGLAVLPTPTPAEAATELERAVRILGLKGAMLCGRTREKSLDHPDFSPIFSTAAKLNVPLYIHPQVPQQAVRDAYYSGFGDHVDHAFAAFGIGWHYEAGIQFVRLLLTGTFDEHPNLQIILGHWGEVVLFYLERISTLSRVTKLKRPIADYFRQNLYVTPSGMWSQPYLPTCARNPRPRTPHVFDEFSLPLHPWRRWPHVRRKSRPLPEKQGSVCSRQLGAPHWSPLAGSTDDPSPQKG